MVLASTASPYKFAADVCRSLGVNAGDLDGEELLGALSNATGTEIPAPLAATLHKPVRFTDVIDPAETVFNVITKSGATSETMTQYLIIYDLLKQKLGDKAIEIYGELSKYFNVEYDDAGSVGKRYRRQDEIGTPMCITYDFDSVEDNCVTVRDRDTMEQVRIPITDLKSYIEKAIEF